MSGHIGAPMWRDTTCAAALCPCGRPAVVDLRLAAGWQPLCEEHGEAVLAGAERRLREMIAAEAAAEEGTAS